MTAEDERYWRDRDFFSELLKQLPSYIFWKDTECTYLGCNDAFARAVGLPSPEEIIGKNDFDLPVAKEQSAAYQADDKEVMRSGKPKLNIEETQTFSNGRKVMLLTNKVPLLNKENKVIGVLGIYMDITERKRLEEDLRKAKEAAEAANQVKTEFLENMRHDIRTPLVGITGCANAIKESIGDPRKIEEVKEYADNLITSGYALYNFLNEVLEIIKVASGEIPRVKKKFDLKEKLLNIIDLNQSKAKQKHLKLILEHDDSIPHYLIGDSTRIQRVILELITNALNFTDKGHVKITTKLARKNEKSIVVKIRVEDTGMGIVPDKQQEVFTRFKRLTPSYEGIYKGTGLGLAVIKQFIDDLEGEIYLESEPGKGSVFTCVIPLTEALLDEQFGVDKTCLEMTKLTLPVFEKKTPVTKAKTIAKELTHILLVEDHAIVAKVTASILTGLACTVDVAQDGKSAFQYAKNHDYDLVFMDIGLPDISGNEVTKKVREWEALRDKHTPIIALTAHIDTENKEQCLHAGMDAVLSKPLSKETALDILNAFIPRRSKQFQKSEKTFQKQSRKEEDELFQLPEKVIDLELGAKLLGGKLESAKEMIKMLADSIPADLAELEKAYKTSDWSTVQKKVHKFHGAASYCGTPRLKLACARLENYLTSGQTNFRDALYDQLLQEIKAVENI